MVNAPNFPLRIFFLTAEFDPFAKVGGLADYSSSLPRAVKKVADENEISLDIRIAIPYHDAFRTDLPNYKKTGNITVKNGPFVGKGVVFEFLYKGLLIYLIRRSGRASGYSTIYNPSQIDDARKFLFFSLAAAELVKELEWQPHIVHANDWHTAMAVHQFAQLKMSEPFYDSTHLLQVIHNMPYLGEGARPLLRHFGFSPTKSHQIPEWARSLPLPMGLVAADWITAVSPSYAEELATIEFGDGLADFFIRNRSKISGILNGIDTDKWNPQTDACITATYSDKTIKKRIENKKALLNELGLDPNPDKPLLIFISRLTPQKGVDILLDCLPQMLNLEWNIVFLSTGQPIYESNLQAFQSAHPNRVRALLEFNDRMAHKLYAGGDILLMPSLYEPCGLSQMIAMHYGCIPVASAVGGLKDSIIPYPNVGSTGYLFKPSDETAFIHSLESALESFNRPEIWVPMQIRAMKKDFSWTSSARQYLELYQRLVFENARA